MPEDLVTTIARWSAATLEVAGIGVVILGALAALAASARALAQHRPPRLVAHHLRHRLAEAILLGLEFLVAADIIYTVAIELTFRSVGVLAAIVLIRTLLSFTLEVEISGRWPWQHDRGESPRTHPPGKPPHDPTR